jgi:hypothetical protein
MSWNTAKRNLSSSFTKADGKKSKPFVSQNRYDPLSVDEDSHPEVSSPHSSSQIYFQTSPTHRPSA